MDINHLLITICYGFLAGVVGTVIGALIPMFAKIKSDRMIAMMMSFAGGFMVAIVFFDLFPESIASSNIWATLLSAIGGVLLIVGLNKLSEKPLEKLQTLHGTENSEKNFMRIGVMMVLAIGLHNLPEGMAIGSKEAVDQGVLLAVLICVHNIPEGMAISAPMLRAGVPKWKTLLIAVATGVPTILGAMIGFLAGSVSPVFISICLGVAGGAMLYIVYEEMFRDSYAISSKKDVTYLNLIGILSGMVLINLL